MDFINKLIKRGIFGLIVVFSFFAFFNVNKVSAACSEPSIELEDGREYLITTPSSNWTDSGVVAKCDDKVHADIRVAIYSDKESDKEYKESNTNSGVNIASDYIRSKGIGFYKIKYSIMDGENELVSITRQIRVLPNNLSIDKNVWVGDVLNNTSKDDSINGIVYVGDLDVYLAVGNFGGKGAVVAFNKLGKMLWAQTLAEKADASITSMTVNAIINNGNEYYVAGQYNGSNGYVAKLTVGDGELVGMAVQTFDNEFTEVNKIAMSTAGNYVVAVGYVINDDLTTSGVVGMCSSDANMALKNVLINKVKDQDDQTKYNNVQSKFNSLTIVNEDGTEGKIVVVGEQKNTTVYNVTGTGGSVTVCHIEVSGLECDFENTSTYVSTNSNGASGTITSFNDVVPHETGGYLIVGETEADGIQNYNKVSGRGKKDALVVLIDENYNMLDAYSQGGANEDKFYTVKKDGENYVVVGNTGVSGTFVAMSVNENKIVVEEKNKRNILGDRNVEIKDIFVKTYAGVSEKQYVFVGNTTSSLLEKVVVAQKGQKDGFVVVLDTTQFSNYNNEIRIAQKTSICEDGESLSCNGANVIDAYKLGYGKELYGFVSDVDTSQPTNIDTYYRLVNKQGAIIEIDVNVIVYAYDVKNFEKEEMGVNIYYTYNRCKFGQCAKYERTTDVENGIGVFYKPVDNYLDKEDGVDYFKIDSSGNFYQDDSNVEYTYLNYVKVPEEPIMSHKTNYVAFLTHAKAVEYSIVQEYARVSVVKGRFSEEEKNIIPFYGEEATLTYSGTKYYFVYYIDYKFGDGECKTENGKLVGDCTNEYGYAFSSLKTINKLLEAFIHDEQYSYFVDFVRTGAMAKPFTVTSDNLPKENGYFWENMSTARYMKEYIDDSDPKNIKNYVEVAKDGWVEVKYYEINKNGNGFASEPTVTPIRGTDELTRITFNPDGTFKNEGKYEIRYCTKYVVGDSDHNDSYCGTSKTFVIDRTAPVIKYKTNDVDAELNRSSTKENPIKLRTDVDIIKEIADIDPYAYIMGEDNQIHYLACSGIVSDPKCIEERTKFVLKSFRYDSEDPNKVFNIKVYDRAGNAFDIYFVIGTDKPYFEIEQQSKELTDGNETTIFKEFSITVSFGEKNPIKSIAVFYTKSIDLNCTSPQTHCVEEEDVNNIKNQMEGYIMHHTSRNNEIKKYVSMLNKEETPQGLKDLLSNILYVEYGCDKESGCDLKEEIVFDFFYDAQYTSEKGESYAVLRVPNFVKTPITKEYTDDEGETQIFTYNIYEEFDKERAEWILISRGLYTFRIMDNFNNSQEGSGGIGIDSADMEVYINSGEDKSKTDSDFLTTFPGKDFEVKAMGGYTNFDKLPTNLLVDFNKDMKFTDKYVYVRFKLSDAGYLTVNRATTLNSVGNYSVFDPTLNEGQGGYTDNLECMFVLFGSEEALNSDHGINCTKQDESDIKLVKGMPLGEIIEGSGVYTLGEFNGYYYIVFTESGTYNVINQVVSIATDVVLPTSASFTIDKVGPSISYELVGQGKGDRPLYTEEDFVFIAGQKDVVNIGSYGFKLIINNDEISWKLLVVKIDSSEPVNAYQEALRHDKENGRYMLFIDTGEYEITFIDSVGNSKTYRFKIDKEPPRILSVGDINNKQPGVYNDYVELKFEVSENSFLKNINTKEDPMFLMNFYIEQEREQVVIWYDQDNQSCAFAKEGERIVAGSINCTGNESGINISLIVEVNKKERKSNYQTINYDFTDYFGNSVAGFSTYVFDNIAPYIYFEGYEPTKKFGDIYVGTEEEEKWLEINHQDIISSINCGGKLFGSNGTIICKDLPDTDLDNGVVVKAYEAHYVTHNNFSIVTANYEKINNGSFRETVFGAFKPLENGKVIDSLTAVYSANFVSYSSKQNLENDIKNGRYIYTKEIYEQVKDGGYIDPSLEYYVGDAKTKVSIKDMYSKNSESEYESYTDIELCSTDKCRLYRKYIENGKFTSLDTDYFVYDNDNYALVTDAQAINTDNYSSYYYASSFYLSEGEYAKAVTLNNTCVMYGDSASNCKLVPADRVKLLEDSEARYYNIVEVEGQENETIVPTINVIDNNGYVSAKRAILDDNIWRIAKKYNESTKKYDEVGFAFGIISSNGRPIIFRAQDGSGNVSNHQLETVIQVNDTIAPRLETVTTVKYEIDDNYNTKTSNNYIKENSLYVKVDDGQAKDPNKTYYYQVETLPLKDGGEYLSHEEFKISFNEPIHKVSCTFYVYDAKAQKTIEKKCSFDGEEYNYYENKVEFDLNIDKELSLSENEDLKNQLNTSVLEGYGYYAYFKVIVYDFPGNHTEVSNFFTDRENPTIKFNSGRENPDIIETEYSNKGSAGTNYGETYKNASSQYLADISGNDLVNLNLNTLTYTVNYQKFNFNITYRNYVWDEEENGFVSVENGLNKNDVRNKYDKIYVLVDINSLNEIVRGHSNQCIDDSYCYIEDDNHNYYPSLINNDAYWQDVDVIDNSVIDVYRISYFVQDRVGNISGTIRKNVYIVDTETPVIKSGGTEVNGGYGYAKEISYEISNEKEAKIYKVSCDEGNYSCELSELVFENSKTYDINGLYNDGENSDKLYKIYVYDSGQYINTRSKYKDSQEDMITLKYNLASYTFAIDRTKPEFKIDAEDDDGLYYVAYAETQEYIYFNCQYEIGNSASIITDEFRGGICSSTGSVFEHPTFRYAVNGNDVDTSVVIGEKYDSSGRLVYRIEYKRYNSLPGYDRELSYVNAYYKINLDKTSQEPKPLVPEAYGVGDMYNKNMFKEDETLYIVTSIKYYFRNDGIHKIQAYDKANNIAGRVKNGENSPSETYSAFLIDNTNPTYNKENTQPTGINYWFLVPKNVVQKTDVSKIQNLVHNAAKAGGDKYNVYGKTTISRDFFYAFATQVEAEAYLQSIYSKDIKRYSISQCENGQTGLSYSYYALGTESNEKPFETKCFESTTQAEEEVKKHFNKLIFPVFSEGGVMFDAYNMGIETIDDNMYKVVYLIIDGDNGSNKRVSITKPTDGNYITIRVKMIKKEEFIVSGGNFTINQTAYSIREDNQTGSKSVYLKDTNNKVSDVLGNDFEINSVVYTYSKETSRVYKKYDISLDLGQLSGSDTSKITVYDSKNNVNTYEANPKQTLKLSLNSGVYYIFEEIDTEITYYNSTYNTKTTHHNLTYYAVYVAPTQKINVFEQDDENILGTIYANDDNSEFFKLNNKEEIFTIIENEIVNEDGVLVAIIRNNLFTIKYDANGNSIAYDEDGVTSVNYVRLDDNKIRKWESTLLVGNVDGGMVALPTVVTNDGYYYLVIKDILKDKDKYEIFESKDGQGTVVKIYSYMQLKICSDDTNSDCTYYNINDYIKQSEKDNPYIVINLIAGEAGGLAKSVYENGKLVGRAAVVSFIDRIGNTTTVRLSHSLIPPSIDVEYNGTDTDNYSEVTITIKDTIVAKMDQSKVQVWFSEDGTNYSEDLTAEVKKSLICASDSLYDCSKSGTPLTYKMTLTNKEKLYGFFKIEYLDDHGNGNKIEFVYNPINLDAQFVKANGEDDKNGIKYIDKTTLEQAGENSSNARMITKGSWVVKWDGIYNYVILEKYVESIGRYVEVCNTKDIESGACKAADIEEKYGIKESGVVTKVNDQQTDTYLYSTLSFSGEGLYRAKIYNRKSEVLASYCKSGEDYKCSNIKNAKNNNEDFYRVISRDIKNSHNGYEYMVIESDTTAPNISTDMFEVLAARGNTTFVDGATYINAYVNMAWDEVDLGVTITCQHTEGDCTKGNTLLPYKASKDRIHKFSPVKGKKDVTYTVTVFDYAGNKNETEITFTISVLLPIIEVHILENGIDIGLLEEGKKTNKDVKLVCYYDNPDDLLPREKVNCDDEYHVELFYSNTGVGYVKSTENDKHENIDHEIKLSSIDMYFKYEVSLKINGEYDSSLGLKVSQEFHIDKKAPSITINVKSENDYKEELDMYRGEVTVGIDDAASVGQIYKGCVYTGVNEIGNKQYTCEETPFVKNFENKYVLDKTGFYMITAKDDVGNETTGEGIKYVYIDNDNPEIFVTTSDKYSTYEVPEYVITNVNSIDVKSSDNSKYYYIKYRKMDSNGDYGEWITEIPDVVGTNSKFNSFKFLEEGGYEVVAYDGMGNESRARHFTIYRQAPTFKVMKGSEEIIEDDEILKHESFYVTWENSKDKLIAPIIKVTMNGVPYTKGTTVTEEGEYVFVFVDLAGNTASRKVTINRSVSICLDNILVTPKAQYRFDNEAIVIKKAKDYTINENDVAIFATPVSYFGGSACGQMIFSYKTLQINKSYVMFNGKILDEFNVRRKVTITFDEADKKAIEELGEVYVFIIDREVAENQFGIVYKPPLVINDPLGFAMIFISVIGFMYLGLKVFVFKKKAKVLK